VRRVSGYFINTPDTIRDTRYALSTRYDTDTYPIRPIRWDSRVYDKRRRTKWPPMDLTMHRQSWSLDWSC